MQKVPRVKEPGRGKERGKKKNLERVVKKKKTSPNLLCSSGNLFVWYKIAFSAKLKLIQRRGSQIIGLTIKSCILGVEIQRSKG